MKKMLQRASMLTLLIVIGMVAVGLVASLFIPVALGATSIATIAVGNTTDTDTMRNDPNAPNLILDDIDKDIADIAPYLAPVDTFTRRATSTRKVRAWKVRFYEADTISVEDVVESQDAASSNKIRNLKVANIDMWRVGDEVQIPTMSGALSSQPLSLYVSTVDRTTSKLGLYAINTTDNVCPVITASTKIYRFAPAFDEEANSCEPYGQVPEDQFNYCQKFMAMVKQTRFSQEQLKEVQWNLQNVEQKALFDLRRTMEFSFINGVGSEFVDPTRKRTVYKTNGIMRYITNIIEYSDTDNFNLFFTEWGKKVFDGNNGSEQRIMFAGSDFMTRLANSTQAQKQLNANSSPVEILGVKFKRIETVFGDFMIYHHQGLREMGLSDHAIIIDQPNLQRRVLKEMTMEDLPGIRESGGGDVDAKTLTETSCLILKNAPAHAIIRLEV